MSVIIALSGRKTAGKNTISRYVRDWCSARRCKSYDYWSVPDELRKGALDEFTMECSFADNIKEFCIDTLGLSPQQCYGTDDEKNTPTEYRWENVSSFFQWKFGSREIKYGGETRHYRDQTDAKRLHDIYYAIYAPSGTCDPAQGCRSGPLSGRDTMQLFGTELIRETFGNVWAKATIRRIKKSGKLLSVITDNRFPNEIEAVLNEPNGYVIRLTRSPFGIDDRHPSESSLDDYDWNRDRCFVLDNADMNIEEQNEAIVPILKDIFRRSDLDV